MTAASVLALVSCRSTPDAGPVRPPAAPATAGTTAVLPVDLTSIPTVTVTARPTSGATGDLRIDAPAILGTGLVHLTFHNESGEDRALLVLRPAPGISAADVETTLALDPSQLDPLVDSLGGSAPIITGATQDSISPLAAGRYDLVAPSVAADGSAVIAPGPAHPLVVGPAADPSAAMATTTAPTAPPATRPATAGPVGSVPPTTVVPAPRPAAQDDALRIATVSDVTLFDYDIGLPDDAHAGWYHVTNTGPQAHELAVLALEPDRTERDATTFLERQALASRPTPGGTVPPGSTPSGSAPSGSGPDPAATSASTTPVDGTAARAGAPFRLHGGLGALSPGAEAWVLLDLPAGQYVAVCSRPALLADAGQSAADHLAHHTHGMAVPFTIT